MSIADALRSEFEHEMQGTRRLLTLVPEERAAWKPHPKSYSLGDLSLHLANLPSWIPMTLQQTEFNLDPPDGSGPPARAFESNAATLAVFDDNVGAAVEALGAAPDDVMTVPWSLKHGATVVFTMPRAAVVRSFVLNHMIHHRGQLTVYLRLCDVPLPETYGPTADSAR